MLAGFKDPVVLYRIRNGARRHDGVELASHAPHRPFIEDIVYNRVLVFFACVLALRHFLLDLHHAYVLHPFKEDLTFVLIGDSFGHSLCVSFSQRHFLSDLIVLECEHFRRVEAQDVPVPDAVSDTVSVYL